MQLTLEYDPRPPFDAGSPIGAGDVLLERYGRVTVAMSADRDVRMKRAAERLALNRV